MNKVLGSRKFVTAIVGALFIGLNDALGLGMDEATQTKVVALLATWILGESVADAAGALKGKTEAPKA